MDGVSLEDTVTDLLGTQALGYSAPALAVKFMVSNKHLLVAVWKFPHQDMCDTTCVRA